jgi:hypothetical protein
MGTVVVRALSDETTAAPVTRLSLSWRTKRVQLEKTGRLEPPTYNGQTKGGSTLMGLNP